MGEWIGAFLLRSLLLIGAVVVFSNGIYMSWNHTHDFATLSGMRGTLATSYTMFVEVILGVSEIVIIFYSFLKTRIPKAVIWGFGFGLVINLIGNILSLISYGGWGVFAGISITVGTIIASAIFASALVRQNEKNRQTDTAVRTPSDSSDTRTVSDSDMMIDIYRKNYFGHSDSPLRIVRTIRKKVSGRTDRRYYLNGQYLGQIKTDTSDIMQDTDGHLVTDSSDSSISDTRTIGNINIRTLRHFTADNTDNTVQTKKTDTLHKPDTSDKIKFQTAPDTQTLEQTDTKSDSLTTSDTSRKTKKQTLQTDNGQRTPRTKIANRINHLLDEEDTYNDDYVYSVAIQYIKENGKRPSIRGLADLAGVKKNKAEKVMKKVKAEQTA